MIIMTHQFGYQSGNKLTTQNNNNNNSDEQEQSTLSEQLNDDTYASSMYYDIQHSLLFITGQTYSTYFDSSSSSNNNVSPEILGAMGMNNDESSHHLDNSDCFLGILKIPQVDGSMVMVGDGDGNAAPWLAQLDEENSNSGGGGSKNEQTNNGAELIYARRFGTSTNSEVCSSILMLPKVNDALISGNGQLKVALLGHVNPTPTVGGGLQTGPDAFGSAVAPNDGGLLHSLSTNPPITAEGHAYGFIIDFDLSLTANETFTPSLPQNAQPNNAYGALLGGTVLDSSPLVYPTSMTQNKRDPNQLYVVSMHSDDDSEEVVLNPEYKADAALELIDGQLRERADMTLGGAGHGINGIKLVRGGVPKYGKDFYVKVTQHIITPYEQLMNVEPTLDEKVKQTMREGWHFGFKLNDANDVRPSTVKFVKGRTPDEDILLLGGTTRKTNDNGEEELDGFITKLIPPSPSPVEDMTTGTTVENAIDDESVHPTKRIDSTTGRDETVTAICLPPPDPVSGLITYAYVVGSTSSSGGGSQHETQDGHDPSLAYILKLQLHDLATIWKQRIPSIHPSGLGGDVLGEGCSVSYDGSIVYLSGTIDGGSVLDKRIMPNSAADIKPVGGKSDVFVSAYNAEFGSVKWARQLGTVYEDKLARGGGVECDNAGNVIIMGSSRGGLQRYRPERSDPSIPMASDMFVMSLSRTDGSYINAPYTGDGNPEVSMSGVQASAVVEKAAETDNSLDEKSGLSTEVAAGIAIVIICIISAVGLFAIRRRRRSKSRNSGEDDVLRMWKRNGGDDFSYDNRPLGGRRDSSSLRIIRGSGDDWDDGSTSISRNASWMPGRNKNLGGRRDDDDSGSVASMGSTSSRGSASSSKAEENSDFLASLRQEANASLNAMIKDTPPDSSGTKDPRLDGGASIKSLLTQYREVKKDTLLDNTADEGKGTPPAMKRKGKHPPPPPPPRRKDNEYEADGLSEFTIV